MKKLKTLALLLFATTLTLASCGDSDDENSKIETPELKGEISFSGELVTKVCLNPESGEFSDYMTDKTDVTAKTEADGSLTIVVKEMTGRPARGEMPASMMTDITFKNVEVTKLNDGSYMFSLDAENFAGIAGGTMDGAFKAYRQGYMNGTFKGKNLTINILDYKFTPSAYEPVMRSVFTGTIK
ncbi:MAG: hypothetical protein IKR91_04150 [Alloprevotella sp.]|nr:hypothetical protein [Alloprevotella sp.]